MNSRIKVVGETLSVRAKSDADTGLGAVRLTGATFPVAPSGTIIELLSLRIPEGLHALALCMENDSEDDGARVDLLLAWKEEDKWFVVSDEKMSATDLARFNPFVRSSGDVLVVDPQDKSVYCSDLEPPESIDTAWVYKFVRMDAILLYITKKLTLAQLAGQAVFERRAKDKLREELEGWKHSWSRVEESRSKEVEDRLNLTADLEKSKWLYELLKRLPAWLRPKALHGYFNAMDFLFNDDEQDPRGC
jgi:hypothetical protein